MRNRWLKRLSLLLAGCLALVSIPGCQSRQNSSLTIGCTGLSGQFSPFYAQSTADQEVMALVSTRLMTVDRDGNRITQAIEGETVAYQGTDYTYTGIADLSESYDASSQTTTYTIQLAPHVRFSDGETMTADDLIFTLYVLADPSYTGPSALSSCAIQGLQEYRTQTTQPVYEKYTQWANELYAAGIDHVWSEDDSWSQSIQEGYWQTVKTAWTAECQTIVDYVLSSYLSDEYISLLSQAFPDIFTEGLTAADVAADPILSVQFGMVMWNFDPTGVTSIDDFYQQSYDRYNGDAEAFFETEQTGSERSSVLEAAASLFIAAYGSQDEDMGGQGVPRIEGITRVSDTEVTVVCNGYDAAALSYLGDISVAPLHYYGNTEQYDYDNNKFGFSYGDLSEIQSKTAAPLGAGPYAFVAYEDGTVTLEANKYYYRGKPSIASVTVTELGDTDPVEAVTSGLVDVVCTTGTSQLFAAIASATDQESADGNAQTLTAVISDSASYGYIGINAATVNVDGQPTSEQSRALRKALATLISAYRELAVEACGDGAMAIDYPLSLSSWAAPQVSDKGYQTAYALDAQQNAIYSSDMSAEEKLEAAVTASLGYWEAAGYQISQGRVVSAPAGAKTSYTLLIEKQSSCASLATTLQDALEEIGITLTITEVSSAAEVTALCERGTQELWAGDRLTSIDPDLTPLYHSESIGHGNLAQISDATLDGLIEEARQCQDQESRKALYLACLEEILDQGIEVPLYQRKQVLLVNTNRVKASTITPDITPYYSWLSEIGAWHWA